MDRLSGLDLSTLLISSAVLGVVPAFIAWKKGRSFFLFWLFSLLFSVIIALPFTLFMKRDQTRLDQRRLAQGERRCPQCQEFISVNASVCPHCHRDLASHTLGVRAETRDLADELTKLVKLRSDGSLTDDEFKELKAKLVKPG